MLRQRHRWWINIKPTLAQRTECAGVDVANLLLLSKERLKNDFLNCRAIICMICVQRSRKGYDQILTKTFIPVKRTYIQSIKSHSSCDIFLSFSDKSVTVTSGACCDTNAFIYFIKVLLELLYNSIHVS